MSANRSSLFAITSLAIAALLLAGATGCATTSSRTAKSGETNPVVERAREHGHTPWRYKHLRHRHLWPMTEAQRPVFPCDECDEEIGRAASEVSGQ